MRIEEGRFFNPHLFFKEVCMLAFEKVLADLRQLSQADQQRLHALLAKELRQAEGFKTLEQIALEQGKRPLKFEELLGPEPDPNIEPGDAWIAATALQFGVPLVTHNRKDYAAVKGLTLISEAP
jgi:predicted nucleic acid-binding protein